MTPPLAQTSMKLLRQPHKITLAMLEVVVMPNGEVISCGKSLGWIKTFKGYLRVASSTHATTPAKET